jgi:hypothetical protein
LGDAEVYYEFLMNRRESSQVGFRQLSLDYMYGSPLIPAAMATAMELMVEITSTDTTSTFVSVKLCFHELTRMPIRDHYLFMNRDGGIIQHWNGAQHSWGSPTSGEPPTWRTIHRLVPPAQLLEGWDDNKVFCIHEWNEQVTLP